MSRSPQSLCHRPSRHVMVEEDFAGKRRRPSWSIASGRSCMTNSSATVVRIGMLPTKAHHPRRIRAGGCGYCICTMVSFFKDALSGSLERPITPTKPCSPRRISWNRAGPDDGAWTALGRPCLPGPYFEIRCVPWVMAAPARSAAATNVVSASSASVAPALSASSLWISMQ